MPKFIISMILNDFREYAHSFHWVNNFIFYIYIYFGCVNNIPHGNLRIIYEVFDIYTLDEAKSIEVSEFSSKTFIL